MKKKLDKRSIYLRSLILKLVAKEKRGHIGSSMSIVEILRVLYDKILKHKNLKSINRDRFILSKGHGCLALYSILYDKKYLNKNHFKNFGTINSILGGHPEHFVPGVEFSTGSLGHGYPIAAGVAKALKLKKNSKNYVYCLLGDGELNEGSIWETCLSVAKHNLTNLITMIDYNKLQSYDYVKYVLDLEPLKSKWISFGFNVIECDGHDVNLIKKKINFAKKYKKKPNVIIFNTIKGRGIKIAESNRFWHHKSNLDVKTINNLKLETN